MAGAKGLERLAQFKRLESLWCFRINQESLNYICACTSLKDLYLDYNIKATNISCLNRLHYLKVLSIDSSSKIDSLTQLSDLQGLEGLAIINFKNVHNIEPLSELQNLKELAIAGSIWTRMKIKSLEPLAKIRNLNYLHLTNLKVEDESLKPLAGLHQLKQLKIANFYPMEEFAWLSGKLKNTECIWFSPYIAMNKSRCRKCGKDTQVMLTGKGKPILCKECDANRLAKHIAAFENCAATAA